MTRIQGAAFAATTDGIDTLASIVGGAGVLVYNASARAFDVEMAPGRLSLLAKARTGRTGRLHVAEPFRDTWHVVEAFPVRSEAA